MYALRAIARRAPRSASQIASYSTKSCALRPTVHNISKTSSSLLSSSRYPSLTSHFSTSAWRSDSSGQELAAKLESEINLEGENNENTTDSDSGVNDFLGQNDFWTLKDTEGEHQILLDRSYDDEKITVSFSIADFNSGSMLPEDEMDEAFADEEDDIEPAQSGGGNTKGAINQGRTGGGNIKVAPEDSIAPADREELRDEEDEDFQSQQAFPANVNVLITRDGKPGALRFALITDGTGFTIDSVTHLPNAAGDVVKLLREPSDTTWAGPPFSQLDEEVQTMMEQYLTSRGINESLAAFIPDYIDVKEQREYLAWLGRVREFVE